jgi:hypothetical protein
MRSPCAPVNAPLRWPKRVVLDQRFRQPGAVNHDELPPAALGVLVDGRGEELLARTGFAGDKHVGVRTRRLGHEIETRLDDGALAHHVREIE